MWKSILPVYKDALQSALDNHILMHKTLLTNSINADLNSNAGASFKGASSGSSWTDTYLSLLSEIQVYGSNVLSSSHHDTGCDNLQLPLFILDPMSKVCGKNTTTDGNGDGSRQYYWLRNVVSTNDFAVCSGSGTSSYGGTSSYYGVRPIFCIG